MLFLSNVSIQQIKVPTNTSAAERRLSAASKEESARWFLHPVGNHCRSCGAAGVHKSLPDFFICCTALHREADKDWLIKTCGADFHNSFLTALVKSSHGALDSRSFFCCYDREHRRLPARFIFSNNNTPCNFLPLCFTFPWITLFFSCHSKKVTWTL